MGATRFLNEPILVVGDGQLAATVSACLISAGHFVYICAENRERYTEAVMPHLEEREKRTGITLSPNTFQFIDKLYDTLPVQLSIIISRENFYKKLALIETVEKYLGADTLVAVNTESIPLSSLQRHAINKERIIGVNWVEPATTSFFMEIIATDGTSPKLVNELLALAKEKWGKDPYILRHDYGIRSRLMCALIREACYLIEHGYVSIEDIDRACRNDAGYYLPFAGNFRYMDLMGTYIYGIVMKDLNKELSKETDIPEFFEAIRKQGGKGMENNKGFYEYKDGDQEVWKQLFLKFSYQIHEIISKFPFA